MPTASALMAIFGIGQEEIVLLRAHAPRLCAHIPAVVDVYYRHISGSEFARRISESTVDDLYRTRITHWTLLLNADFDALIQHHADHLKPRFIEHDFPPSIMVMAAHWFAVEMVRIVDAAHDLPADVRTALVRSIIHLSFIDLALAESARNVVWLD